MGMRKQTRVRSRGITPDVPVGQEEYARDLVKKNLERSSEGMDSQPQEQGGGFGSAVQEAAKSIGTEVATQGGAQGNEANIAGGALMATGNPYAIGAGAGLMVLGAKEQRKDQYKRDLYESQIKRIERQQEALESLMSMAGRMQL